MAGEVVLVTDAGEEILKAGDCAGFKAGDKDGHHLQNRSNQTMCCCWKSVPASKRWRGIS